MKWQGSEDYVCVKLGEQDYLLPFGQKIVDYYAGLKVNEIGVMLWERLKRGVEEEELLELLCSHYQADEEDVALLKEDLDEFLRQLHMRGAVRALRKDQSVAGGAKPLCFRAGELTIAYLGPESIYETYFKAFACDGKDADQTVELRLGYPMETVNGRVLVRSGEFILMEGEESYVMLFPVFQDVYEMQVEKSGRWCRLYCSPEMSEEEQEDIFHAMRFSFLVLAQSRGLCVVHSASFLYRGRAWLFSGKSGTGKSTHTNLWKDAYGVELLNGDLNCVGIRDGEAWVLGLPWCGTSGTATPKAYPLGGVVFLKQCQENLTRELSEAEKACSLAMRMITPTWTQKQLEGNLRLAEEIAGRCMMVRLCCTKDPEAAAVMRDYIDRWLDARNPESDG